jgi:hypothetical protein
MKERRKTTIVFLMSLGIGKTSPVFDTPTGILTTKPRRGDEAPSGAAQLVDRVFPEAPVRY